MISQKLCVQQSAQHVQPDIKNFKKAINNNMDNVSNALL